jgi:hypothetical protein
MEARVQNRLFRSFTVLSGLFTLGLASQSLGLAAEFPPCPPPAANEYLLLVRGESEAERTRIQNLLPSNSTVMVCSYLEDTVVRGGGFTNLETANAWAQYMTEVEQLQAFVARPATGTSEESVPVSNENSASPPSGAIAADESDSEEQTSAFSPRNLGTGYAVLVNYQNQPEVALAVQEQVGQAVGLAVYRQLPYLLIAHSSDIEGAESTLRVLAERQIPGFIVNSREVVMLAPAIATNF